MTNRLIAIADIHGEYYKLVSLIKKLNLTADDICVFLGDYIDRGLYSKAVIDYLIELSKICRCEFLTGNHEYFMLKMFEGDNSARNFFYDYGGVQTVDSYGAEENIMKVHGDFYRNLKYYYQTDDYFFVHAGVRPDKPLKEQENFDMVMIRDNFIYRQHSLSQKVVFGHTPFKEPFIVPDKIGIDLGCGKYETSPLTALICNEETFVYS